MEGLTGFVIFATRKQARMNQLAWSRVCTPNVCVPVHEPIFSPGGLTQVASLLAIADLELPAWPAPVTAQTVFSNQSKLAQTMSSALMADHLKKKVHFSFPTTFGRNQNSGILEHADAESSVSFQEATRLPKKVVWNGIGRMNSHWGIGECVLKPWLIVLVPQETLLYCSEEIVLKHFFLTWKSA